MGKPKILLQLDTDDQPSVFDSVVAVDSGVEQLLRHQNVTPQAVRELVHGAIFTRGGDDLARTAIFIGGSDVAAGERLLEVVNDAFFGPLRVSVMLDSAGANTTAAAVVSAAGKHLELSDTHALVLAATGPVGRRVVRLLARQGAQVRVASRSRDRAQEVCDSVTAVVPSATLKPCEFHSSAGRAAAIDGVQLIVSAGAAGIELLAKADWQNCTTLAVAIDLSAIPPPGIAGIEATNRATVREHQDGRQTILYGALGIGAAKMKIHKAALRSLFERNYHVLDAEEIYEIAQAL